MKSSRKAVVKAQQPGQLPATGEESLVSSDSESKDPAGEAFFSMMTLILTNRLKRLFIQIYSL